MGAEVSHLSNVKEILNDTKRLSILKEGYIQKHVARAHSRQFRTTWIVLKTQRILLCYKTKYKNELIEVFDLLQYDEIDSSSALSSRQFKLVSSKQSMAHLFKTNNNPEMLDWVKCIKSAQNKTKGIKTENMDVTIAPELEEKVEFQNDYGSYQFQTLFNGESEMDGLEVEGEYDFSFQVNVAGNLGKFEGLLNNDNENNIEQRVQRLNELRIVYKKFFFCSALTWILCLIILISASVNKFYNWNGIIFNFFVVLAALFGVFISIYDDIHYNNFTTKSRKLKLLLIYFMMTMIFIFVIFIIGIVYVILTPIRASLYYNYSNGVIVGTVFFGFFGLCFWTIFVLFYVDLCARACLKRGRIDFVIIRMNNKHWFRFYYTVILFRIKFRKLRRFLTAVTGIHCIKGKIKGTSAANPGKLHEEQKVLEVLGDDELELNMKKTECDCKQCEIDLKSKMDKITNICGKLLCCPCIILSAVFEKINPMYIFCGLIFCYLFAPIAMYILIFLILAFPCISTRERSAFWIIPLCVAIPVTWAVWYKGICPNNGFNYDEFPKQWNWTMQCIIWDYSSWIIIYIVGTLAPR
eukprot:523982_1